MQFKTAIRNFISNNRIAHRCFVSICARFSMRLYSLQTYLSLEDLRAKGRARLWRRVMALLERPALEKIVIANGKATFFYVDSCCFGVETNTISLSSTLFSHGDYEQNETRLIAKIVKPGWTVIDAGANFGWHSIHLSRLVGPQGKVLAFEPVPDSYEELRANILKDVGPAY